MIYNTEKQIDVSRAIFINGKNKNIGTFTTEIEAHFAYQNELKKISNNQNYL